MQLACQLTRWKLAGLADDADALERLDGHFATCLRCQAEAARYRTLVRHLGALAESEETAPIGFGDAVDRRIRGLHAVDGSPGLRSQAGRAAAVVGALAAAAGAAVVVKLVRTRSAA